MADWILGNKNMQLELEGQLLRIVNNMYEKTHLVLVIYMLIDFVKLSGSAVNDITSIIDVNDMISRTLKLFFSMHRMKLKQIKMKQRTV